MSDIAPFTCVLGDGLWLCLLRLLLLLLPEQLHLLCDGDAARVVVAEPVHEEDDGQDGEDKHHERQQRHHVRRRVRLLGVRRPVRHARALGDFVRTSEHGTRSVQKAGGEWAPKKVRHCIYMTSIAPGPARDVNVTLFQMLWRD